MCGRYTEGRSWQEIHDYLSAYLGEADLSGGIPNLQPRYNIAPTQAAPIVRKVGERWRLSLYRWGLLPPWSKDTKAASRAINARAETVAEKPTFSEAFRARRCLVVADGYYEWIARAKVRQPYRVVRRDDSPMMLAGVWERWRIPAGLQPTGEYGGYGPGDEVRSYAIITTSRSEDLAVLHDRMPVALEPDDCARWLVEGARELLRPSAPDSLRAYPVSPHMNAPRNDDPTCIAAISEVAASP